MATRQPMCLYPERTDAVPAYLADKLEREAARYWERFYRRNRANFFKDRHYLLLEFPDLAVSNGNSPVIFEVGCGVGNTLYPLLQEIPAARCYACDFSATAVECLREHAAFDPNRITAWEEDITSDAGLCGPGKAPANGVDYCTLVFVLSALAPDKMPQAVRNMAQALQKGTGKVLFRDYAENDLAHGRLGDVGKQQKLGENFYVRGDGTRCFYFSEAGLRELFEAEGYRCDSLLVHEKTVQNRAQGIAMERRWIQAVFTFMGDGPISSLPISNSTLPPIQPRCVPEGQHTSPSVEVTKFSGVRDGARVRQQLPAEAAAEAHMGAAHIPSGAHSEGGAGACVGHAVESEGVESRGGDAGQQLEWEVSAEDGMLGSELGGMFQEPIEMTEELVTLQHGYSVKVETVARVHKNTVSHTGLMLWEAALPLARFILACPSLFSWRAVIELGCGGGGLCALAGAHTCRGFTATDGSPQALELLRRNLGSNAPAFIYERVGVQQLEWNNASQIRALQTKHPLGVDVVVGADVVYVEEAVPLLFSTAAALLTKGSDARLVLAHTSRRVSEDKIISHASAAGFSLQEWSDDVAAAAAIVGISRESHMRLLVFERTL